MRVLICDDQAIIRHGLAMILRLTTDIEVVGLAEHGNEALRLVEQVAPDLVLMDLKLPGMTGVEVTRQIRQRFAATQVLVLTTYDDDQWIFDALRAGACGYLLKDTPPEDLLKAIRGAVEGKVFIDPAVAGKLVTHITGRSAQPASTITARLTEREVDVLRLIASGYSNTTIAERLHLSDGTVRNHVSAIIAKLEVDDRTQAALIAVQHGVIERRIHFPG
jgi:two-component system, NarL family, response regulator LiaR